MTTATHIENANFLRELAESLPRLHPKTHKPEQIELLQRLANDELAQAEYDEQVRVKVAAVRADTRPGMTTEQLSQLLQKRFEELHRAL